MKAGRKFALRFFLCRESKYGVNLTSKLGVNFYRT